MRRTPIAISAGFLLMGFYSLMMYMVPLVWLDNTSYEHSATGLALISLGFGLPMWICLRPAPDKAVYYAD